MLREGEETAACEAGCRRRRGKASSCFAARGERCGKEEKVWQVSLPSHHSPPLASNHPLGALKMGLGGFRILFTGNLCPLQASGSMRRVFEPAFLRSEGCVNPRQSSGLVAFRLPCPSGEGSFGAWANAPLRVPSAPSLCYCTGRHGLARRVVKQRFQYISHNKLLRRKTERKTQIAGL